MAKGVFSRLFSRDERQSASERETPADAQASSHATTAPPEPASDEVKTAPRIRRPAAIPPLPAAASESSSGARRAPQLPPLPPGKRAVATTPGPDGVTAEPAHSLESDVLVDAAVEALIAPDAQHKPERETRPRAAMQLFAQDAPAHAAPLFELMFQLSIGQTPPTWLSACRPRLRPLLTAARQADLTELTDALIAFDALLERPGDDSSFLIGDVARDALLAGYERLHTLAPEVFAALSRSDSRRRVLLEAVLLQVPALHRRTLTKLYAAGVSSLAQLSRAEPEQLSAEVGLDRELAQAMIEHVRRFERERSRYEPNSLRGHVQTRLRNTLGKLTQLQAEFERAEQEDNRLRKRTVRRARDAALLELERLVAELGDIDMIEQLRRCPVRTKIGRLQSYLQEVRP